MAEKIINLVDLTKKYGDVVAVDHLSLSIKKGEIFGLLGPNGAGKSTTILMILGLTEPTSGKVTIGGVDATSNPVEVKKKVGYLPEDIGFYEDRSGFENLVYTARLNRIPLTEAQQKALSLLDRVGLSEAADKKAGTYSHGMRQRLGLADVLIKKPEIVILDEPTLGIDPLGVRELLDLIVHLSREEGLTVLLSSHHLHQVQSVCHRVGLFVSGKLIAEGNIPELSRQLFNNEPFQIEAGISLGLGEQSEMERLHHILENTEGVIRVKRNENIFQIGCTGDISPQIARIIVESDAGLQYLVKKDLGLDDIYQRYFEGRENHERLEEAGSSY